MGILNVTPDSFSDAARFRDPESAVAGAHEMLAQGADIIDVGGESTRPQGAEPVSEDEELARVLPVIRRLARERPDATLSIDTVKSAVARAALEAGAHVVNDVSALRLDSRMAGVCAAARCGLVLMHSRGSVSDMGTYAHAQYGDVVPEVLDELRGRLRVAEEAGVAPESICLDPGLGFAKRTEHSLAVLAALPRLVHWGFPVLVGASRKRFVGEISGAPEPASRLPGTLGAHVVALVLGARIFRVHDVLPARQALDAAWAILRAREA